MRQEPDNRAQEAEDKSRSTTSAVDKKPSLPTVIDNDFHPIRIKGEPLSETIIRERRERPW
jgi:hypothetical protein